VLLLLLGGGILVAYYQLAQTVLIVLRRQAWGTPGMVVASLGVLLAARPLVASMGLRGAAWAYCAAVAVLVLCSGGFAVCHFRAAFAESADGGGA
jgi:O-antigen/teichoic acid export membrane protein